MQFCICFCRITLASLNTLEPSCKSSILAHRPKQVALYIDDLIYWYPRSIAQYHKAAIVVNLFYRSGRVNIGTAGFLFVRHKIGEADFRLLSNVLLYYAKPLLLSVNLAVSATAAS